MIDISVFKGEIPKLSGKKLPEGYATSAINCKLETGNLEPVKGVLSQQNVDAGAETIYRMGESWLQWNNKINIVESLVNDSGGRILFTGDDYPKETNIDLALDSAPCPAATRRLGIAAPTAAPTATITVTGTGSDREIAYCYTRVGLWADGTVVESAPSPSTDVFTAKDDATVQIDDFVDATETGTYTTHYRIYRINTGDTGAEYQYVDDLIKTASPLEYDDTVDDDDLGEVLPTEGWTAPVDELHGITPGANGLVFGFKGNTIYPSETFIPYAFPDEYSLAVDSEIVGLGNNGTAVVVMTKTKTHSIYGASPESLSLDPNPLDIPCKSARSIMSVPGGVIYASTAGLQMVDTAGAATNLTADIFTRVQWEALDPSKMFSFFYNNTYTAFWAGTNKGIEFKPGINEIRRFELDELVYGGRYVSTVSINLYDLEDSDGEEILTSEGYQVVVTGGDYSLGYDTLYLIQENGAVREIVAWEAGDYLDYTWEKEFFYSKQEVFTAGYIYGDFTNGNVTVSLYVDGVLSFTKEISSDGVFRIPPKRGNEFKVKFVGKAMIETARFGGSVVEVLSGY